MTQATELIAKQMAAGANIGRIWGNLIFNVKDTAYGAKGEGITDDTAAIQAAINAAGAAGGGVVYFPIGVYLISSTLNIGDGSGSAASTINNVFLQGQGIITATFPSSTQNDATILKWTGAAGGTMVYFKGPIVGGGIDGIELKGNLVAGIGLRLTSVTCASFPRLSIQHCTQKGLVLDVVTGTITLAGTLNTSYNRFGILQIYVADTNGTVGLELDGNRLAPASADSSGNYFESIAISWNAFSGKGINLRFCDNNYFGNVVMVAGARTSGNGIFFDAYEPTVSFPSNNVFGYLGTTFPGQSGTPGDNFAWMYGEAPLAAPTIPALSGRMWDGTTFGIMRKNSLIGGNIYKTVAQNILSDGTFQAVAFDNTRFDTDSMHSNVTNNSRVTIKVPGTYSIKANVRFAANATGIRAAKIRVNGTTDIALQHYPALSASYDTVYTFIAPDYQFALNDYFELLVFQDSAVGLNLVAVGSAPSLSWTRVG